MDYLDIIIFFEVMEVEKVNCYIVFIFIVYCFLLLIVNYFFISFFMNEFFFFLESCIIKIGLFLIVGDFNFYVDDIFDVVVVNFLGLLEFFDLR